MKKYIALFILVLLLMNTVTAQASEEEYRTSAVTEDEANAYIEDKKDDVISAVLNNAFNYKTDDIDTNSIIVFSPFKAYSSTVNGLVILDNIIYYPVGTSDQILGLVSVYKINVDIEYCVSDWLVDEMNRYHFLDGGYQVVIDYPDDDSRPGVHFISAGRDIDIYNDEPEQSVQMRDDPYVNYLSSFQAFVFPTQGFYINLLTYKKLNMDYCLVTQGADRCGAACVSTIYRYRTATAVLNENR
ncbi:MAG: hypothetical protein IJL78_10105 [Lachnospiraceae bacterium]|nr:hypothetical protein [Lachnospiraceae bacterium]